MASGTATDQRPTRLWDRNFSRLWTGETVSFFGSQITTFALPIVALQLLDSSAFEVTLINTAAGVGTIVFILLLSPLADSPNRRRLMTGLSLARAATIGLVIGAFAFGFLDLWVLLVAALLISGFTALYDSTFSATVPQVVHTGQLTRANTWVGGMRSVADIGSGGVAGLILYFFSPVVLFVGDFITYLAAAWAVHGIRLHAPTSRAPKVTIGGYVRSLGDGFRYLWSDKTQLTIVLAIAQFNFFTTGIQALYVIYAIRVVGLSTAEAGIGASLGGVIGCLGILIAPRLLDRVRLRTLLIATFALPGLCGVGFLLMDGRNHVLSVAIYAIVLGFWATLVLINITATESIKQVLVPNAMMGRFTGASRLLTWGVDPFGAALAGALTLLIGVESSLLVLSLGVVTSAAWILLVPRARRLGLFSSLVRP